MAAFVIGAIVNWIGRRGLTAEIVVLVEPRSRPSAIEEPVTSAKASACYLFMSICRLMFGFARSSNWLRVLVLLFLPSFSA